MAIPFVKFRGTRVSEEARPLRADARRNRARILEVAFEAFASDGLSVPVQEIARRAGVGTGTVSRHFPTKESLFEAILLSRAGQLVDEAARLARSDDPGAAFFEFFSLVIAEGSANLGLAEALAGAGFDFENRGGLGVMGALNDLLARAQRAGAVRADVDAMDVKALISGCLARAPKTADLATRDRMISIARQGLRNALSGRSFGWVHRRANLPRVSSIQARLISLPRCPE
jgi:AcrR family transcriptional regulator